VLIAEDQKGEVHAFIFCIKDIYDSTNSTLIVKSVVRKKSSPFKGIATYLYAKIIEMAKKGGYTKIIHALMINDNASHKISKTQTGQSYKSYSLFGFKI
jgi:L-amino acid N-acyltransferase YncA